MKAPSLLFASLLLSANWALAWTPVAESALRSALESSGYTLIAFVLPSQKASSDLEPEWEALEKAEADPNIVSFDCGASPGLCRELKILSYPAIRLYHRDGRVDRYRGERKTVPIASFLHRAFRPAPFDVNEHTLEPFLESDEVVFVCHLDPEDDSLYGRYRTLAQQYRDRFSFGLSGPLQKQHGQSAVRCRNNIDDEEHLLPTELGTVEALERFVKMCSAPLIPEITRQNEAEYSQSGKSLMHYFVTTDKEKAQYRKEVRPLAKKYSEFVHFTITDLNEYPEMLAVVGLKAGAKTGLALENPNTGEMFPYRGRQKITGEVVDEFLNDIIDGKIEALTRGGGRGAGHDEL